MPYGNSAYGNSDYLAKRQQQQERVEAIRQKRIAMENGRSTRSNYSKSRTTDRVRVTFNALMSGVSDDILTAKQAKELWVAITEEGQPDDTPVVARHTRTVAQPKSQERRRSYSPPIKPQQKYGMDDDSDWEGQEEQLAREEEELQRKKEERARKKALQAQQDREKRRAKEREREEQRKREEEDMWAREDAEMAERERLERDRQDRDRRAKPAGGREAHPRTPERSSRHPTSSMRREPARARETPLDDEDLDAQLEEAEREKAAKFKQELQEAEHTQARLVPCNVCGRRFNEDRIGKHEMACEKSANSKRKVFNTSEQRKTEDMAQVAPSYASTAPEKKPAKIAKWKRDHLAFQKALKSGKSAGSGGGAMGGPTEEDIDDRTLCPHCNRKFNPDVAERHIPKCKNIINKPGIRRR